MTERYGKTRRPSGTMATPRATISSGRSPSIRRPSRTISPAASRASPVMARSVVVLPAPFAPMRGHDVALVEIDRHVRDGPHLVVPHREVGGPEVAHDGPSASARRSLGALAVAALVAPVLLLRLPVDLQLVLRPPEIGFDDALVALDLRRSPLRDLAPEVEHQHPVADPHDRAHVVLDEEHRYPPVADPAHHVHRPVGLLGVHAREGLVEEQDAGFRGHRDRDPEGAEVSVGEVAGGLVRDLPEAEVVDDLARALAEGGFGGARAPAAKEEPGEGRVALEVVGDDHVVEGGHLPEDGRLLKGPDRAAPGDRVRRPPRDVFPGEPHPPRARPQERGDELEQGALARSVRADDAEDPAFLDRERHLVDGREDPRSAW